MSEEVERLLAELKQIEEDQKAKQPEIDAKVRKELMEDNERTKPRGVRTSSTHSKERIR